MFCTNCGHRLEKCEDFCSECGTRIVANNGQDSENVINQGTLKEQLAKNNPFISLYKKIKELLSKVKNFGVNHKKPCLIVTGASVAIMIGFVLFYTFYDFTKLYWDTENGDASITHTQSTTLNLYVLAYDKEKQPITEIKFSSNDGEVLSDKNSVKWKLPKEAGSYTITAEAPSGKKISKTIKVVDLKNSDEKPNSLAGIIEIPVDDETADNDQDGITNLEEQKLETDVNSADSDQDGLSDYYEINVSKTDPLKKDTDGDGIHDGDELDLGLDPLKTDSKGDGILDGQRSLNYKIENTKLGVSVIINGKGNIASSTIDVFENSTFQDMDGLTDKVYNFYTDGTIESAVVNIHYDIEDIEAKGLSEDALTLYYFNEETKELEALPTTVDKEKKQIIVTLKHFSKYVIGDRNVVLTNKTSEIMFVIDNSVSMYNMDQMIAAGFDASTGAVGNDVSFKRLTLTNKLVDMFTGNYRFGVAEFSGNYVNLQTFSDEHDSVKNSVNSMKSHWQSNAKGTNIVSALKNGIKEFKTEDASHYLILLTDGKNTEGSLSNSKSAIMSSAKSSNVKVCVIGLGSNIDTEDLNEIAESTGCDYYNASDASALDEIYSLVGADINYNYVDTDGDNLVDGMIEENSGFLVNRDGFSFENFSSNKAIGHCYGMATFAMLYYKNQLPLTLGAKDNTKFYLDYFKKINMSSNGYDLKNTYFAKNKKLYDFKITNEGLSILLEELPSDYRDRVIDDTWMIKEEYYKKMSDIGVTFSIKDYKGEEDFSKYQSALLNIDNDTFNNAVSKDEAGMLNAIWRLFILQRGAKNISFSSDPDEAWEGLLTSLADKTPQVLAINDNHAVNAIRLIQDISNANRFKIEVYDNNFPGETKYITVTRSKYNKIQLDYTAWVNEYDYTFTYDSNNDGVEEKTTVKLSNPTIE